MSHSIREISQNELSIEELRPLYPRFFIPPLEDKPQNPIIDNLVLLGARNPRTQEGDNLENEASLLVLDALETKVTGQGSEQTDLDWEELSKVTLPRALNLSWDNIRQERPSHCGSAFLSEQPRPLWSAVNSRNNRYISNRMLKECLKSTIMGESSRIHVWDDINERFQPTFSQEDEGRSFGIDDLSDRSFRSLLVRFLDIGALLRRLDKFVLASRSRRMSQDVHALAHCVYLVIARLRTQFSGDDFPDNLTEAWIHYQDELQVLEALGSLCRRDMKRSPPYDPLPTSRQQLLSHVYSHFNHHMSSFSPRQVNATLAFVLQNTASEWMKSVGEAIGIVAPADAVTRLPELGPNNGNMEHDLVLVFPSFFPRSSTEQISRARRSLKLLMEVRPLHPLCLMAGALDGAMMEGWVWTEEDIEERLDRVEEHVQAMKQQIANWRRGAPLIEHRSYDARTGPPDGTIPPSPSSLDGQQFLTGHDHMLNALAKFDLDPGTHPTRSTPQAQLQTAESRLHEFISRFPERLPLSTPTLEYLTQSAVIDPLLAHSRLLSASLIELFFTDMKFLSHLNVLKRFLLFGDSRFAANLRGALFDETDDPQPVGRGKRAQTRARLAITDVRDQGVGSDGAEWGIGLSLGLSEREHWPPGETELGISLRRVIVDAMDLESADEVTAEAEWRLGFILRALEDEDESVQEKWMDPMALEALDFLTMQYKPPQTLGVLITQDIMSKYQRIFNFILRLMRVEAVARVVYNSTLKLKANLFPGLPDSHARFYLFHSQIQSFAMALKTYIFDCAIEHHWSSFISRLSDLGGGDVDDDPDGTVESIRTDAEEGAHEYLEDAFSIEAYHSTVLDKILTACLLKARHRNVGDALKDCMELVLSLGILVRSLKRGKLGELEGSKRLAALHDRWMRAMRKLLDMLRALDERGHNYHSGEESQNVHLLAHGGKRSANARDLHLKLDPGNWYGLRRSHSTTSRAA